MTGLIKSLARRIIFGRREPKTFPPLRIPIGQVVERVLLRTQSSVADISDRHCIVCHSPFAVAIQVKAQEFERLDPNAVVLEIVTQGNPSADATGKISLKIEDGNYTIIIVTLSSSHCHQLSSIRQFIMREYFKNKNTRREDAFYAALYSFPRRVISVSFSNAEHANIFPMDFQCFMKDTNTYVLGLRTTNTTLEKIISDKKVVIGDTDRAPLETIYMLGKHHGTRPPSMEQLPFAVAWSEKYEFPIADYSAGYKEIEIVEHHQLGTHMLLIGKVRNEVQLREWQSSLYHMHFFQSFHADYLKA